MAAMQAQLDEVRKQSEERSTAMSESTAARHETELGELRQRLAEQASRADLLEAAASKAEQEKLRKLAAAQAAARAAEREAEEWRLQLQQQTAGGEELRAQLDELRKQNGDVISARELTAEELRRELNKDCASLGVEHRVRDAPFEPAAARRGLAGLTISDHDELASIGERFTDPKRVEVVLDCVDALLGHGTGWPLQWVAIHAQCYPILQLAYRLG